MAVWEEPVVGVAQWEAVVKRGCLPRASRSAPTGSRYVCIHRALIFLLFDFATFPDVFFSLTEAASVNMVNNRDHNSD